MVLLPGLSGLALDALAGVADALALVGLGLADLADVGGDLADRLLVDALHRDARRRGHLELDALRRLHADGVAEAERELDGVRALRGGAVADADDLQLLHEAVGDAEHHVVDQRARETVLRAVRTLVVRPLDDQLVLVLADGDDAGQVALERAP